MLRFFRNIRKQLAAENKVAKYLRYAVGEILLVVIGILIALQINNWNEYRKERNLEQEYYFKFLEDLNQDAEHIKGLIEGNEARIKSSNELIHLLQQKNPKRKQVVNKMAEATSKTTFTFKPSMAAFEDLKSSGNLKIIKDLFIKNKLINYYSKLEGLIDVVDKNSEAAVALYFSTQKDYTKIGWQDIEFVSKEIDTDLVNSESLKFKQYPSTELREKMISDAVFYLGTNARKKLIYKQIVNDIQSMRKKLVKKCNNESSINEK